MLKILRCALIIGAFGSGGMVAAAYFRRQVAVLESFLRVVSSIGARIGFCLTPLEKIFSELDDQQLDGFLEEARQIGAGKAFENCREQQYLSDSEKNLLGTFFRELGTRSAGEEKLRLCRGQTVSRARVAPRGTTEKNEAQPLALLFDRYNDNNYAILNEQNETEGKHYGR